MPRHGMAVLVLHHPGAPVELVSAQFPLPRTACSRAAHRAQDHRVEPAMTPAAIEFLDRVLLRWNTTFEHRARIRAILTLLPDDATGVERDWVEQEAENPVE